MTALGPAGSVPLAASPHHTPPKKAASLTTLPNCRPALTVRGERNLPPLFF